MTTERCEDACKVERSPKHIVIFESIDRLKYRIGQLERLAEKIRGNDSDKGLGADQVEPALIDILEGTPKEIDDINERLDIVLKELNNLLF